MLTRFCYILENEAQELLRAQGYRVHILKKPEDRHGLPLCILALRKPDESRYVMIHKMICKPGVLSDVEARCWKEIAQFRKFIAGTPPDPGRHCEFWIFSSRTGFHRYEVLQDCIRERSTLASSVPDAHLLSVKHPAAMSGAS